MFEFSYLYIKKFLKVRSMKHIQVYEYVVSKDTNAYKLSLESIQSMKHMIQILSRTIIVCVLVVLSLVLVLWLRVRIHEIGVLLSIGKSKMEIIVQFIFELVFISFPSGIILCAFSVIKY